MVRMRLVTSELKNVGHQVGSRDTQASRAHIEKAHLLSVMPIEAAITYVKYFTKHNQSLFLKEFQKPNNLENSGSSKNKMIHEMKNTRKICRK